MGLLEKVIRSYIRMAEEKTETAKAIIEKKSAAEPAQAAVLSSISEVDDLDNLSMADMTLLKWVKSMQVFGLAWNYFYHYFIN